ncbi:MAG: GntR family transcriptional regulator [Gemmatimonadales bacterium]|nr:GntR family transcriptional regulator [Gemmatimonadales bacterium]NIN10863.1 GntR family transcriptional regulator [Gemmatimonadales bacterium]NIR02871.1 GntR family transcriptional regulator [Gemmatimonadales bacterium]NIS66505.1 GntR family transcriptional regulator [Gemmatimonadales bacterium]
MSDHERAGIAERLAMYLDPGTDEPLYRQIVDRMWLEVVTGTLETGERLPTVRQLAIDLGVHPNTVARAYEELQLLGVLLNRPGEGTFVGLAPPDKPALERRAQLERLCRDILSQSEALGISLDYVIETLTELRSSGRDSRAGRESE